MIDTPESELATPIVDITDSAVNKANYVPAADTISSVTELAKPHAVDYEGFDPAIHATNPDGTPKRRIRHGVETGAFAKKRGRKGGTMTPSGSADCVLPPKPANTNTNAHSTTSTGDVISADEMGRQCANWFINGAVVLLGEDWQPDDKQEGTALKASFVNYFDAAGVPQISPLWGLVLAIGAYSLKRVAMPTFAERVSGAWDKLKRMLRV